MKLTTEFHFIRFLLKIYILCVYVYLVYYCRYMERINFLIFFFPIQKFLICYVILRMQCYSNMQLLVPQYFKLCRNVCSFIHFRFLSNRKPEKGGIIFGNCQILECPQKTLHTYVIYAFRQKSIDLLRRVTNGIHFVFSKFERDFYIFS